MARKKTTAADPAEETNRRQIIDKILAETETLLTSNWGEIERTRNERGNDGKIKLSISALVDYNGAERAIKTSLAFGVRHKDARESVINPLQPDLDGMDGQEPE